MVAKVHVVMQLCWQCVAVLVVISFWSGISLASFVTSVEIEEGEAVKTDLPIFSKGC
jgi:hypothetical protein